MSNTVQQPNRRTQNLDICLLKDQTNCMMTMMMQEENTQIDLETKYSYLFEHIPSLFMMLKEKSVAQDQLPFIFHMFSQAQKVQTGESDAYKTDVSIGKILAEKYIVPVVKK